MESQPQNSEFRINPENFHPCDSKFMGHAPSRGMVEHFEIYVMKMIQIGMDSSNENWIL